MKTSDKFNRLTKPMLVKKAIIQNGDGLTDLQTSLIWGIGKDLQEVYELAHKPIANQPMWAVSVERIFLPRSPATVVIKDDKGGVWECLLTLGENRTLVITNPRSLRVTDNPINSRCIA